MRKTIMMTLCGFAAGIAFVVACGGGRGPGGSPDGGLFDGGLFDAGRDAEAGVPDCTRWEVVSIPDGHLAATGETVVSASDPGTELTVRAAPAGWEAFSAFEGLPVVYQFRRCAD